VPDSCCDANDFSLVVLVIHNTTDTQAHDVERWEVFWCVGIGFGEWVEVFGIGDSRLKFTPGDLGQGVSLT